MKSYREQCVVAKDVKRGIVDQPSGKGRSKRDTPIVVEFRLAEDRGTFFNSLYGNWRIAGRYRTDAIADQFIAKDRLKWVSFTPEYRKTDTRQRATNTSEGRATAPAASESPLQPCQPSCARVR